MILITSSALAIICTVVLVCIVALILENILGAVEKVVWTSLAAMLYLCLISILTTSF